jgi:predicted DNA-binding transcriptional regulator YafY
MVFTGIERDFAIATALLYEKPIKIMYNNHNKDEVTIREVFPLHVTDDQKNLLTVCNLRKNFRKFKLENIVGVQPTH